MDSSSNAFPADASGLPDARRPEVLNLESGAEIDLRIGPVAKRLGDATVRMLAYNNSIPGPTLRVHQGSDVVVTVINAGDLETTVHWHGLRLENRYDGTAQTQQPIAVGGRFTYRLTFPDPGIYWYHPHIREDYAQEMGLYGNIVVVPAEPDYWPPAHREVALTLDDVLVEHGRIALFDRSHPTYTAMGRFGNVFLVNGEVGSSLRARRGEVVRFYLTNTANTRVFNVGLDGTRMKLVGDDSGRCEHEAFVESVLVAPSERVVVDVLFESQGELTFEHRTPGHAYPLASVTVDEQQIDASLSSSFESLRTNDDLAAERARINKYWTAAPDKTLALVAEMDMGETEAGPGATVAFICPMHPEITSAQPDRCPKCG